MRGYTPYAELPFATLRSSDSGVEAVGNFYFSKFGFISSSGIAPEHTLYDPRVIQPLRFVRTILNGGYMSGITDVDGEILLDNTDGGLDSMLIGNSFIGRSVTVKLGATDFATSEFGTIFNGLMDVVDNTEDVIRITVRCKTFNLDAPVQTNLYDGTGGNEGSTNLEDKPKPLAYGVVRNVPAILVDAANLIYQVHDGSVNDIPAVYDRGVLLTAVASSVAPGLGEYQNNSSVGMFKLGGSPSGEVTADVEGDNSSGYVTKTADIVKRVMLTKGSYSATELESTSFDKLNTLSTAAVGIWVGTNITSVREVVDELLKGIGAFGYFSNLAVFSVGRFDLPINPAILSLDQDKIISIVRSNISTVGNPPVWRTRVGYQRNYTVQTDLAGSVDSARREFATQPYRLATASDSAVLNRFAITNEPEPIASYFDNQVDALAEAVRIQEITGDMHYIYEIITKESVQDIKLNSVVSLTYPRWELKNGKLGRVVGIDVDNDLNENRLVIFI